jgi:hypothetical protein
MVKSAQHGISDDDAAPLDWPTVWSVLVNSELSPRRVVICGVCLQDMPKMCLTPDDHMVEAFTADRPDRTFDVSKSAMVIGVRWGDRECPLLEAAE